MDNKVQMSSENLAQMLKFMRWFQYVPTLLLWACGAWSYYNNGGLGTLYLPVLLFITGCVVFWSSHFRVLKQLKSMTEESTAPRPKKSIIKVQGKAKPKAKK